MCYHTKIGNIYKKTYYNSGKLLFFAHISQERITMKYFISRHLYKTIYILILFIILFSVFAFEARVYSDRKNYAVPRRKSFVGVVKSVPSLSGGNLSFTMDTGGKSGIRELVYVTIEHGENLSACIGDTIRLIGLCSAPNGAQNPGAFDFGSYIKSKGASLFMQSDISMINEHQKGLFHPIYAMRQRVTDEVGKHISAPQSGLVNALITGSKELISDQSAELYRKSGIYHIVAVSGLHLNMLILFLSVLYMRLRLNQRKKALVSLAVTLLGCGFMFVFTGFGVSVVRAAFMALFVCASGVFGREYSPFASLFAVFAIILITEPHFCADASFCLSFSATVGILIGVRIVQKIKPTRFKWLWESLVMSLCASITTLPFIVHYFGAVSIVSPLTNLIVLNIAPVLLAFSYLFAIVCIPCPDNIANIFASIAEALAYCVNTVSTLFASLPFSYVYVTARTMIAILVCISAIWLFIRFKSRGLRIAVCAAIIVANLVSLSYNRLAPFCTVTFLNAGQGDSSIIYGSDGFAAMIDCGSESTGSFGNTQAIPYMRKQGITKLDLMLVTHFHEDHTSGIVSLIEADYIKRIVLPDRPLFEDEVSAARKIYVAAAKRNIPITHASNGDTLTCGKHSFNILNPQKVRYSDANDGSMVIKYKYEESTVLFCGDIENAGQYNLLNTIGPCDIVKIAHHGGESSMSQRFADKLNAGYAIISCGVNNKYSHPDEDTLKAYKSSVILRTDTENAPISFIINSTGIRRKNHARY